MKKDMGNILVTGGLGFIGSHLVTRLKELGYDPTICDLKNGTDIRTIDSLSEFNTVFHLAALTGVQRSFEEPAEFFSTNVWGTYNILSKAYEGKVRRVINVSSNSAIKMYSPLGVAKACSEFMAERHKNTVTLRPFNVFGENQLTEAVIPQFIANSMADRSSIVYGRGIQSRDFTYVGDVVGELIWYAENRKVTGVHDMGYRQQRSLNEVLSMVRDYFGCKKPAIQLKWRKGDQFSSRAKEKIHFISTGFEAGLFKTMEWFKEKRPKLEVILANSEFENSK